MGIKSKIEAIILTLLLALLLAVSNLVIDRWTGYVDLTEDKRFSLSESTASLIRDVDETIYIRVLLEGQFPAGFKRLKEATKDILRQFHSINANIEFVFENPDEGSVKEINSRREILSSVGINPVNLRIMEEGQRTEKLIYPFALLNLGSRQTIANLLEEQTLRTNEEEVLNRSVNMLEYKLANAISKLVNTERPNVLISKGNGVLSEIQTASLTQTLSLYYDVGKIDLDSVYQIGKEADVLFVIKPTEAFSKKDQFKIDQYIMNGGKVVWMIEKFHASLDSIARYKNYVPKVIEHGLDDMFFTYGVRLKDNLILDVECSKIPQVIGMSGDKPQTALFDWYYHPILQGNPEHPLSKNVGLVNMFFPSTIDTLKTKFPLRKTALLSSSNYSRYQVYPMRLNFQMLKADRDVSKFNKGSQLVALLEEGTFVSHFKNRVSETMVEGLESIGASFKEQSEETKQVFISDADFIRNLYNPEDNRISDIGYNKWEDKVYKGNQTFLINLIEYLVDDYGLLESRSKDVKLRLLDKAKIQEEKRGWQLLNVGLPIVLLLLFGFAYHYIRRRKYE